MTLHQKWFEELSSMMTVTAIVALLVLGVFFYMEEAVMDFTPKVPKHRLAALRLSL